VAKAIQSMSGFDNGTMKTAVAVSQIFAKGVDNLSRAWAKLANETLSASLGAAEDLAACKSFEKLVDIQSSFAKTQYDRFLAGQEKLSALSVALVRETMAPIQEEADAVADRFIKLLVA
jgi:Phasin protein.